MLKGTNILHHLRLVLMALTLLCVVGLNNREVTTYAAPPKTPAKHQVNQTAAETHGTVKQKVSFEGTYSYIVLQVAACPELLRVVFTSPLPVCSPALKVFSTISGFFSRYLVSANQPNAP